MHITLSPVLSVEAVALHRLGDVLTIGQTAYDFSDLTEGATLPASAIGCASITGDVTRRDGALRLTLVLPHGDDAPHDQRFPAPLAPAPEGRVDLPGHPGADHPGSLEGAIDWSAMVTPEAAAAAELAAWRAACDVPRLSLVLALASAGVISPASAIAAAGGAVPPEFEALVAAMPEAAQNETRIRWAGAATIPRLSPFILAVQAAAGLTDAQVDALFGRVA